MRKYNSGFTWLVHVVQRLLPQIRHVSEGSTVVVRIYHCRYLKCSPFSVRGSSLADLNVPSAPIRVGASEGRFPSPKIKVRKFEFSKKKSVFFSIILTYYYASFVLMDHLCLPGSVVVEVKLGFWRNLIFVSFGLLGADVLCHCVLK